MRPRISDPGHRSSSGAGTVWSFGCGCNPVVSREILKSSFLRWPTLGLGPVIWVKFGEQNDSIVTKRLFFPHPLLSVNTFSFCLHLKKKKKKERKNRNKVDSQLCQILVMTA